MSTLLRRGPIYDLLGVRLQDLDGGCGRCGKRLAEVITDVTRQWNAGDVVCVDCHYQAPPTVRPDHYVQVVPSKATPGKRIAVCRCGRFSMVTTEGKAQEWADRHREAVA